MDVEIKTVLSTFDSFLADTAMAILKEEGILAIDDRNTYLYLLTGRTNSSTINVKVSAEDYQKAVEILTNIRLENSIV